MPLSGSFKSQLRYWAGHALFCASPSFLLALAGGYDSWTAIGAMLSAIALFIGLYALASSREYFRNKIRPGILGRAIHLGAKFRSVVALLGLIGFFTPAVLRWSIPFYFTLPDIYCGMIATSITESITGQAVYQMGGQNTVDTFVRTFMTTVFDGILLSGTLVAAILLCLIVVKLRSRLRRPDPMSEAGTA